VNNLYNRRLGQTDSAHERPRQQQQQQQQQQQLGFSHPFVACRNFKKHTRSNKQLVSATS
jgi:hypothetical protein